MVETLQSWFIFRDYRDARIVLGSGKCRTAAPYNYSTRAVDRGPYDIIFR